MDIREFVYGVVDQLSDVAPEGTEVEFRLNVYPWYNNNRGGWELTVSEEMPKTPFHIIHFTINLPCGKAQNNSRNE